jgi:hypothetical protein
VENKSYSPFVGAVNTALLELRKLNPAGILPSKGNDDPDAMLFHHNDKEMYQGHQGEVSTRKPDVVIVPLQVAEDVQKDGDFNKSPDTYGMSRDKPSGNFQWKDIRSTVEFKRSKTRINPPPARYELTDYTAPKEKYVEYRKGMDASGELRGSVPASAATSAHAQTASSVGKPSGLSTCLLLTYQSPKTVHAKENRAEQAYCRASRLERAQQQALQEQQRES